MTARWPSTALTVGFLVLGWSPAASAQFSDDFESYAPGGLLSGQGGWVDQGDMTLVGATVQTAEAHSGTSSIGIRNGTVALRQIAGATSGEWVISTYTFASSVGPSECLAYQWTVLNDYQEYGFPEIACTFTIEPCNGILRFTGGGSSIFSPLRLDLWVELRVEVDLDADYAEAFYDGELIKTWAWSTGDTGLESFSQNRIDALQIFKLPLDHYDAYFDDMRVDPVTVGQRYCESLINSTGDHALLRAKGSASISANNLTLTSGPVPNQPSIFFRGDFAVQVPFGDGLLCAAGSLKLLYPVLATVEGAASARIDLPSAGIVGGTHHFQHWFRDPDGGSAAYNMSDAIEIVFVP